MIAPPPPAHPVYPSIDFETYSEAGYVWDEAERKWRGLPHAPQGKRGLKVVGAAVYAMHPSTEIVTLSYDLLRGEGVKRWQPGMPLPMDLFTYIEQGGLLAAWNSAFEHWIWNCAGLRKYGFPPLPLEQLRDTQARARAHALAPKLEMSASVLVAAQQKDPEGERLIRFFSVPRNPTKKDDRRRNLPAEHPAEAEKFYAYCDQDVRTEAGIASMIPDLTPDELQVWLLDQRINYRGVQIDTKGVEDCIALIEQAHEQYDRELFILTNGTVEKASQVQRFIGWLGAQGVHTASLDEESVDSLLTIPNLPPHVRRALEIRQTVGSAAVKKAFAMQNSVTSYGRLHDLFFYYAARTGRATGNGPQPTNLPNSGPAVYRCAACGAYYGTQHKIACPVCANTVGATEHEWGPEAAEYALEVIGHRSLALLEWIFGNAMAAVSGSLRGLFIARDGHDLIGSDYTAIEAVVIAELAGETWRQEVFRTHGKIYEMSAAKISRVPFEEFMAHAGYTPQQLTQPAWWEQKPENKGKHHPLRKTIGKVAELACFGPDTQVLTDRGYVGIMDVLITDRVWDGVEWVYHDGAVYKGEKAVLNLDGVKVTPTHPISIDYSWLAASALASNENILDRALATGSANLPSSVLNLEIAGGSRLSLLGVLAARFRACMSVISGRGNRLDAERAPGNRAREHGSKRSTSNTTTDTQRTSPRGGIGAVLSTDCPLRLADAITGRRDSTEITADEGFRYARSGGRTGGRFSGTSLRYRGGMMRAWRWIVSITRGGINRATFGSSRKQKIDVTRERSDDFSSESMTLSGVYDIVNAGPRHRFTIKTDSGHLLVHNSGYQGWIGAWTEFGADEFMNEEEMKEAILAWRAASPEIVKFWGGQPRNGWGDYRGVEGMFVQAIMYPGYTFEYRGMTFTMRGDAIYLRLLSGRELVYHRPRLEEGDRGGYSISYEGYNTNPNNGPTHQWIRMRTWGGRLTENIVQATARDILMPALLRLDATGYPIVLHVYDEAVAEVPKGFGSAAEMEQIMMQPLPWTAGWPVRASGGWRGRRFRK